jgi:hypothetical protein
MVQKWTEETILYTPDRSRQEQKRPGWLGVVARIVDTANCTSPHKHTRHRHRRKVQDKYLLICT